MYKPRISLLTGIGGISSTAVISLVIASFLVENDSFQRGLWYTAAIFIVAAFTLYAAAFVWIRKQEKIEGERREEEILRHVALKKSLEQFIKLKGIESEEAVGTPTVKTTQIIGPSSIESGEEFGEPKVDLVEDEADTNQD